MNHWIVPSNIKYFDVEKAFKRYGMIDWHKLCNYKLGDIVYIYLSKPNQRIAYKCKVILETVRENDILDDSDFYIFPYNKKIYIEGDKKGKPKKFSRFKLLKETKDKTLSYDNLKKIGIKSNIRGPINNLTKGQVEYIESCFDKHLDFIPSEEVDIKGCKKYYEGAIKRVIVNKYERDDKAREMCIAHYGTRCQVCGVDLGKVYGLIGEDYIEVHHLKPLSKIHKGYNINPIKDMIPVCPNCHAMIHNAEHKGYNISNLLYIRKLFKF